MKAVIETFKPVKGYEGLYEVSDYGAVRSLKFGKVRYMKPAKCRGYERIYLFRNGKPKKFSVHRLVWEAFVGPIPDAYEIDHINTIRDDNRLDNLRCVTPKENHANQITAKRHRETHQRLAKDPKWVESHSEAMRQLAKDPKWREAKREAGKRLSQDPKWRESVREETRKACNKPILQIDKTTGEVIRRWECARDVERELGIKHCNISLCCHGRYKSAGGYCWRFAD